MNNPFVFHEILTPEPETLSEFYRQLFAWRFEVCTDNGLPFWLVFKSGIDQPVGLLSQASGEPGFAQATIFYVQVDDIDKTLASVKEHQGEVVMGKIDSTLSHWRYQLAVVADPQGNQFGIMAPIQQNGKPVEAIQSPFRFNEIITENPQQMVKDFYHPLFDWTITPDGSEESDFYAISTDGGKSQQAGITQTKEEPGYAKAATFYVEVEDITGTLELAEKLKAQVKMNITTVPLGQGLYDIAMFNDPQGNLLGLIRKKQT